MSSEVLKDQKIWFDRYDLTGYANACSLEYAAESLDETCFGDDTRIFKGGLKTVAAGIEGLFDETPDGAIPTNIGSDGKILTIGTSGTEGAAAYFFKATAGTYTLGGQIGELLKYSLSAAANTKLVRGTLMENNTAAGSTANGTGRQLGAIGASQKMYAAIHVLGATGTSPTLDLVIKSDDNSGFTSETSRITFTQATGATAEWKELSGAVADDYWRATWTIGGSDTPTFDFIVVIGIL